MNDLIINKTIDFIKNNSNYSNKDFIKIRYGLEGVYLTISKLLIILLIGIIGNYLDTVLLTLLFFNILRFFAFGLHAKKSIQCLIISVIEFNILTYFLLKVSVSHNFLIIISIISLISFLLFAPSDTLKRPLTNKKKRIIRKVLSIVSLLIMFVLAYYILYFRVSIVAAFIIEDFSINPLSYKLLGLSYNNYKRLKI